MLMRSLQMFKNKSAGLAVNSNGRRNFAPSVLKIDPNVNYYQLIGLKSGANDNDIKKSYYSLAKKYHPDSTERMSATVKQDFEDKFKSISAAYEILSDPDKRRTYDELVALNSLNQGKRQSTKSTRTRSDDVRGGFEADESQSFTYDSTGKKRESTRENFYKRDTYGTPQYNYQQSFKQSASYTTDAYRADRDMGDNDALLRLAVGTLGAVGLVTLATALVTTNPAAQQSTGGNSRGYESTANEYRVSAMRSISISGQNLNSPLISKGALEGKGPKE